MKITLKNLIIRLIFSIIIALLKASHFFMDVYYIIANIADTEAFLLLLIGLLPLIITIFIVIIPFIYKKLIKSFIENLIYMILIAIIWLFVIIPLTLILDVDTYIKIPGTAILLSYIITWELISALNPYNIGKLLSYYFYKDKVFINGQRLSNDYKLSFDIKKLSSFIMNNDSDKDSSSNERDTSLAQGNSSLNESGTTETNKRKRKGNSSLDQRLQKRTKSNNLGKQRQRPENLIQQRSEDSVEQTQTWKKRVSYRIRHTMFWYDEWMPTESIKDKYYNTVSGPLTTKAEGLKLNFTYKKDNTAYTKQPDWYTRNTLEKDELIKKNKQYLKYAEGKDIRESLKLFRWNVESGRSQAISRVKGSTTSKALGENLIRKTPSKLTKDGYNPGLQKAKVVTQAEEKLFKYPQNGPKRIRSESPYVNLWKRIRLEPTKDFSEAVANSLSKYAKIAPAPEKPDEPLGLIPKKDIDVNKDDAATLNKDKSTSKQEFQEWQKDLIDKMSEEQFSVIEKQPKSVMIRLMKNFREIMIDDKVMIVTKRSLDTDIDWSPKSRYWQDRSIAVKRIQYSNTQTMLEESLEPITMLDIEQRAAIFNLPYPFSDINQTCVDYKDDILSNLHPPKPFTFRHEPDPKKLWLDTNYVKPYVVYCPIIRDEQVPPKIIESFKFSKWLYNSNCRHMSIWSAHWFEVVRKDKVIAQGLPWDTYHGVWLEADAQIENAVSAAYVLENARAMVVDHREKCKLALVEMYATNKGENDYDEYERVFDAEKITLRDLGIHDLSPGAVTTCFPNLVKYFVNSGYSVDENITGMMIFDISLKDY